LLDRLASAPDHLTEYGSGSANGLADRNSERDNDSDRRQDEDDLPPVRLARERMRSGTWVLDPVERPGHEARIPPLHADVSASSPSASLNGRLLSSPPRTRSFLTCARSIEPGGAAWPNPGTAPETPSSRQYRRADSCPSHCTKTSSRTKRRPGRSRRGTPDRRSRRSMIHRRPLSPGR
jgi:hypothetical protein